MLNETGKEAIVVTSIFGALAIVAVALRFYCRLRIQLIPATSDDWCMLAALILYAFVAIGGDYIAATSPLSTPSAHPSPADVIFTLKMAVALNNAQILCMGLLKISLLLYYRRIFTWSICRTSIDILMGVAVVFSAVIIFLSLCSKGIPVSKQWDPTVKPVYALRSAAILTAFCGGNVALDTITLALPLVVIRKLRMSRNKKLRISMVFGMGSFCMVASILRLYFSVQQLHEHSERSNLESRLNRAILWGLIEPPSYMLTVSLLTLGPLYRRIRGPHTLSQALRSTMYAVSGREALPRDPGHFESGGTVDKLHIRDATLSRNRTSSPDIIEDKVDSRLAFEIKELDEGRTGRTPKRTQSMI